MQKGGDSLEQKGRFMTMTSKKKDKKDPQLKKKLLKRSEKEVEIRPCIIVDPPLSDPPSIRNTKDLNKAYKKLLDTYINKTRHLEKQYSELRGRMILSDPEGVIGNKESRKKRWEAEKLEAKNFRQKIRRYLFAGLIIIGAILVILRG